MPHGSKIRPSPAFFHLCLTLLAITLSICWLDRPLSTWSHDHLHGVAGLVWLTWIAEPIPLIAMLGLVGVGGATLLGYQLGPRGRLLLALCLAALVAIELKELLKFAAGRTWPETWINGNPSWIGNQEFGFSPFHGGPGWASFPSGHTTSITAVAAVLWQGIPRWRWLWATLVGLVALGLLGADYHWLSDVLGGVYLGAVIGLTLHALIAQAPARREPEPPPSPAA